MGKRKLYPDDAVVFEVIGGAGKSGYHGYVIGAHVEGQGPDDVFDQNDYIECFGPCVWSKGDIFQTVKGVDLLPLTPAARDMLAIVEEKT